MDLHYLIKDENGFYRPSDNTCFTTSRLVLDKILGEFVIYADTEKGYRSGYVMGWYYSRDMKIRYLIYGNKNPTTFPPNNPRREGYGWRSITPASIIDIRGARNKNS